MTDSKTARPGQKTGQYPPSARASVTRHEPDDRDDEIHTTRTTGSEIKSSSSHPWRLHAARAGNVGRSDGRDRDITHKEEYIMNQRNREALAAEEGAAWMEAALIDADEDDEAEWFSMEWPAFSQALSEANAPAFPSFETASETDAAYDAAWDEARRIEASRR